jgi:hypothetical protein
MPQTGKPCLRALAGPLAGKEFPLNRDTLSLGRGRDNDIVLPDPELSERQATLRLEGDRWVLVNCGRETHIFERHIPVESCEFQPGNPIRVGSTTFELVYREADAEERAGQAAKAQPLTPGSALGGRPEADFFAKALTRPAEERGAGPGRPVFAPGQSLPGARIPVPRDKAPEGEALPSGLEEEPAEELPARPRYAALARVGNLAYTVLIVGLVVGGAFLIQLLGRRPPETPTQCLLIHEGGEGSIVSIWPYSYDQIGDPGGEDLWKQIVDVKRVDPPIMVELVGKNQGTAEVPLYSGTQLIRMIRVTVRGRAWKEPVFRPNRDIDTLLREAEECLERGRQLQRDFLYQAIEECYRPAADFLSRLSDPRARSLETEARQLLLAGEREMDRRLKEIEDEFWRAHYLKDLNRGLRQLQLVLELVPDGSDKRHQRAAIMADVIRKRPGQ